MGNRTSASDAVAKTQTTSAYNALNQLTGQSSYSTSTGAAVGTGSSAFGYDGDGNMSLVTAKDATGTVTGQTSYAYDDASRLIGITTPGSSKWQFVYDGMSRLRISRSWNWVNGAWVQNSEVHRVYLGMDVVQERDANNNVTTSYTKGNLARSTAAGSVFYGYDGSGNVTSLTDATGAIVGSYTYDAWGNTLTSSGPKAQENPYRYSGKEQLAGYYSYGFRFYNAGMGRWINRDPIKERGGRNLYEFVGANPTNKADRHGLQSSITPWSPQIYPPNNGFAGSSTPGQWYQGDILQRTGGNGGNFFTTPGTSPPDIALPPANPAYPPPLRFFEVMKPYGDGYVQEGQAAPWGSPNYGGGGQFEWWGNGGGTQYVTQHNLQDLLDKGIVQEIPSPAEPASGGIGGAVGEFCEIAGEVGGEIGGAVGEIGEVGGEIGGAVG